MTDSGATAYRSRMAASLGAEDAGAELVLVGWVHRLRDLGGLLFLDLRDRSGVLQVSCGPDWTGRESLELAARLGAEDVVRVEGTVALRPDEARNPEMATGDVELRAVRLERLNEAATPAIPVYRGPEDELPSEKLRLRHRVLDLRRPELQENLILRHRIVLAARNHLDGLGFVEVETPILTKPTPEGARDYLVPSRNHPGEFFALPQSPQLYKQILMAAGLDRYFQIARCFRDEDLRADRQPEFTQIDVEASFIEPDDLFGWIEGLMAEVAAVAGVETGGGTAPPGGVVAPPDGVVRPFSRMTHAEVLERYGSDRPDLRWSLEIREWTDAFSGTEFRVLSSAVEAGGRIRGLLLEGGARLSRREVEEIESAAKAAGAPGLLWLKRTGDDTSGPLARWVEDGQLDAMGLGDGDLALVAAGTDRVTSPALAAARSAAIAALELPPATEAAWLWITDFPLFEEEDGALVPGHHPFCMPNPEDVERLESEPHTVRSLAYDLVYNGSELGSGSIRVHDPGLQRRILRVLGMADDEIDRRFGFLLEALGSGAPPHGGIALGVDRIVKDLVGAASLRDVIAFPKTTAARALFEGAPTPVSEKDLKELHLRLAVEAAVSDQETE